MKVAFISGPYSADTLEQKLLNIAEAKKVAYKYWHKGYAVICPHANSGGMENDDNDQKTFYEGDIELLSRCDLIILMRRWEESDGARKEREYAIEHNIERLYL